MEQHHTPYTQRVFFSSLNLNKFRDRTKISQPDRIILSNVQAIASYSNMFRICNVYAVRAFATAAYAKSSLAKKTKPHTHKKLPPKQNPILLFLLCVFFFVVFSASRAMKKAKNILYTSPDISNDWLSLWLFFFFFLILIILKLMAHRL